MTAAAQVLADALVECILAEIRGRGLSIEELAETIGMDVARLRHRLHASESTQRPVVMNVRDLALISWGLGSTPDALLRQAQDRVRGTTT